MIKNFNSALLMCVALSSPGSQANELPGQEQKKMAGLLQKQTTPLSVQQKYLSLLAALGAAGNISGLNSALNQALDAGVPVKDCREVLVQIYAYAGFPRSLNALAELMKVAEARRLQDQTDVQGSEPGPIPAPQDMLEAGTRNQTLLVGQPVKGALFDFAPTIDQYLKAHLFGDIFERDNIDWKSRELATVGALAAMNGVDSQLKSHLNISRNVGLSKEQLAELIPFFKKHDELQTAERLESALDSL